VLIDGDLFAVVGWYDAAEVLFTIGLVLLVLAILAESAFACCHCGLQKAWVPTLVGSLTLVAGIHTVMYHHALVVLKPRPLFVILHYYNGRS